MAIETITLRPTSNYVTEKYAGMARNPADTAEENIYLLVNEEIADDDATYIQPDARSPFFAGFSIQDKYKALEPSAIRVYVRMYSADGKGGLNIGESIATNESCVGGLVIAASIPQSYTLMEFEVPKEKSLNLWTRLCGNDAQYLPYLPIYIVFMKGNEMAITQLYLEVDFEIKDTTTSEIYIKRDGTWLEVTQQLQKVNGTWTEITANECKEILINNFTVVS